MVFLLSLVVSFGLGAAGVYYCCNTKSKMPYPISSSGGRRWSTDEKAIEGMRALRAEKRRQAAEQQAATCTHEA